MAKRDGKLLLVCVYDPKEFICQALNRDLWNNKEVKEFVKENFIFLYVILSSSLVVFDQFSSQIRVPRANVISISIISTIIHMWGSSTLLPERE